MLDFNIEEYKAKQQKMQKKEQKIRRKKQIRQAIWGSIIFVVLMAILSVTEVGCKQLQEYINSQVAPFIEQTKLADENVKYDVVNLRYSDHFKKLMEENFKDSFLIKLQSFVAYTNSFGGRNFQAFKTFGYYNTYFSHLIPKEEAFELKFWEMSTAKDAGQYLTAGELMQEFFAEYGPNDAGIWYAKIENLHKGWIQVPMSIRDNNQPQIY